MFYPGQTTFVPAARFQWLPDQGGLPLGRLVYGRRYLERRHAVPLDPLELPLTSRLYETRMLGGIFGALRDGAPDYWGRRDLALTCGDQGRRANADNLLSQCGRFLLSREAAAKTLDEMEALVRARWYEVARREGVSERDCARIAGAFAYPGFR